MTKALLSFPHSFVIPSSFVIPTFICHSLFPFVIPAKAGIHKSPAGIYCLDPRLRGDDTAVSLCTLVLSFSLLVFSFLKFIEN
jgi:hypothetical protein